MKITPQIQIDPRCAIPIRIIAPVIDAAGDAVRRDRILDTGPDASIWTITQRRTVNAPHGKTHPGVPAQVRLGLPAPESGRTANQAAQVCRVALHEWVHVAQLQQLGASAQRYGMLAAEQDADETVRLLTSPEMSIDLRQACWALADWLKARALELKLAAARAADKRRREREFYADGRRKRTPRTNNANEGASQ